MFLDIILYTPMYVTFFWSIILLSSYAQNNRAKHFLGYFMVLAFLLYLSHVFYFKKFTVLYSVFESVYIFTNLAVYPMYYLYLRLLTVEVSCKLKNLRHLYPAVFFAIVSIVLLLLTDSPKAYIEKRMGITDLPMSFMESWHARLYLLTRAVFLFQVLYYSFAGLKLVKNYESRVVEFYSNLEGKSITWARMLLYSFLITSFFSAVLNVIGRAYFLSASYLLIIPSVLFSVLHFFIGFQGYLQNHNVTNLIQDEQDGVAIGEQSLPPVLHRKLIELMENRRLYRQSDLKITHVCMHLQTNRTYVSNLINKEFDCSFSEFVNRYRIKEATDLLKSECGKNLSIAEIGMQTGFGSLNSFIRTFKQMEGMPPGKFREQIHRDTQ
jgi:AraC-like DNA-binding protein